ncbi:MAG: polyprenyl synthetase family protein [Chloroflexota bacterium]|nr:polyprenyl synthetase family protein [Chloroflexota bacterium]
MKPVGMDELHRRYGPSLEAEMRSIVQHGEDRQGSLFGMIRYHLGWVDSRFERCEATSGKRVRPILCLLSCEGCGGAWEAALPAAAAVELLHNFTLIHDDIEDRDRTRRGRPTVWSIWGEEQGINAGDTLFALSQLALLRLEERGVPPAAVVEAARLFNETCVAITSGQHFDIQFEGQDDVSVEDYLTMIDAKTAALLSCSCRLGALVAQASAAQREQLHAFGRHSGLSFQMLDDVLGIWGDSTVTGKPVGADIARRKKTLPLLHGLERSAELRELLARECLSEDHVRRAQRLLEEAGSRRYAEELARRHHDAALTALERANLHGPAARALRELTESLLNRRR